jgi:hypothetical protein
MIPGLQLEEIWKAFLSAYDKKSLTILLRTRLDRDLLDIVGDGAFRDMAFELLDTAEMEGWQGDLVRAAYRYNPANEDMLRVYEKYGFAPKIDLLQGGSPIAGAENKASSAGLQKVIRADNPMLDIDQWRTRLTQLELRVCRIDIAGRGTGTGFLIGPGLVLTNFHVVEAILSGKKSAADITCLFDFKVLSNNKLNPGTRVPLHSQNPILLSSPYTAAEKAAKPDDTPPTEKELDYAVLQLDQPFPADPDPSARGYEVLPSQMPEFTPGQGIIIAQHPAGAPMKLAIDTQAVISVNANNTRVRYKTNTEGGSSGSPVFDLLWGLSALHHYGDPSFASPTYNQGVVPLHLIRQQIEEAGYGALLG